RLLFPARLRAGSYAPSEEAIERWLDMGAEYALARSTEEVNLDLDAAPESAPATARHLAVWAFLEWRLARSDDVFSRQGALNYARQAARLDPLWLPLAEALRRGLWSFVS